MTNPNWGLLNGGGFQNALAQGLQYGQQITARREQREDRNALLEMRKAEFEDRRAEREATAAAKAEQAQQADMGTFRKLLKRAAQSPEGWAQAMGAAQSLGLDVRQVPQAYDPAWAQQQLFIMDAMEKDPEGMKGIAYELQMAGYKPGTPDFEAAARSVISNKYASEYVDEAGNTRRRSALNLETPAAGAVAYDPNEWEEVEQGGPQASPAATFRP